MNPVPSVETAPAIRPQRPPEATNRRHPASVAERVKGWDVTWALAVVLSMLLDAVIGLVTKLLSPAIGPDGSP